MSKLNLRQLCFIVVTTFTINKLFFLPGLISGIAEEGLLLATSINFLIDFLLLLTILYLYKKCGYSSVYDMFYNTYGKKMAKVILFIYAIFFMVKMIIPVLEEKNSIELTFYETQPNIMTFLPIFVITLYICSKGLKTFARSMEIALLIFALGIILILLLSFSVGDYDNLLPFFAKPPKVILTASFKTLLWFGDPIYLLFFIGETKRDNTIAKKLIISFLISMGITLLIFTVFYSIFGSIASRQFYAPIKMSKYSLTLSSIGRFDYLATLLLSFVSVFQLGMPLLFSSYLLEKVFNFRHRFVSCLIVNLTACILTLIFENGFFKILDVFQRYVIWFLIAFTYVIPLVTAIFYRSKRYETKKI